MKEKLQKIYSSKVVQAIFIILPFVEFITSYMVLNVDFPITLGVIYKKGEANTVTNINKAKAFCEKNNITLVTLNFKGLYILHKSVVYVKKREKTT